MSNVLVCIPCCKPSCLSCCAAVIMSSLLLGATFTIASISSSANTTPGAVLRSRQGNVKIDAQGEVVNRGTLAGQKGLAGTAQTILNEGVSDSQARMESSAGATVLQAGNDLKNLSGSIYGATHTSATSDKGDVIIETQVNQAGTQLLAPASIGSGGDLVLKAGRDMKLVSTEVEAEGNASLEAAGNFEALTAQTDKKHIPMKASISKRRASSPAPPTSKSHTTKTQQVTNHGTSFNIGGNMRIKSQGNAKMIGADVTADKVDIDAQGNLEIRTAYDSTHTEELHSTQNKKSSWLGLSQDNQSSSTQRVHGKQKAVGNTWQVNSLDAHGKK